MSRYTKDNYLKYQAFVKAADESGLDISDVFCKDQDIISKFESRHCGFRSVLNREAFSFATLTRATFKVS